jgi:ketosteroid isomerase-like protein
MRRLTIFALATLAAWGVPIRSAGAQAGAEAQIMAVEHAFAAAAGRDGLRDAFLAFADDGALTFAPEPANAKAVWRARPRTSALLTWYPSFARAARSGDLGFTTGPYTSADSAEHVTGHGQYVTVWRKTPDGWRFVVDVGTTGPRPADPEPEWRPAAEQPTSTTVDPDAARSLAEADRRFVAHAARNGLAAAVQTYADAEMRLLRPRLPPRVGQNPSLAAAMLDRARRYTARPKGATASAAGDLGWTWGEYRYENSGAGRRETGHYVRIWSRDPGGPWRVLLDIVAPRPSERDE